MVEGVVIKPEGLLEKNKEGGSRTVFPKCKQKELEVFIYGPLWITCFYHKYFFVVKEEGW